MDEETYLNPEAKSDQKIVTNKGLHPTPEQEEHRSSKTLVYILLAAVALSIVFLIFGLVVLRINAPSLRLSNVVVKDLRYSNSSFNATFIADIRLHNMNFGRFDFRGGSAALYYGNATVGAVIIFGGRVGGRRRRNIDATVEVMGGPSSAANYLNISRDIESNLVKLVGVAELRGEIRVMKIVNRWRTAMMNCTMDLNLTGQAIQGLSCQ